MKTPSRGLVCVVAAVALGMGLSAVVWGQGPPPGAPQGPPPGGGGRGGRGPGAAVTPRQQAPVDLTGTWVSVVTEEWRIRMMTPRKGMDFDGLPMTPAARAAAMAWDPAADEAAGLQCKGYGAPGLMRLPGRARISWEDDATLKLEYDTGQQTRLLHFGGRPPAGSAPSWQGYSVAEWETVAPVLARGGRARGAAPPAGPAGPGGGGGFNPFGGGAPQLSRSLKVVTTQLRPGYLRKNGVPYGANAVLTEYFDLRTEQNGDTWFTIVSITDDAENLGGAGTYISSSDFKKEADGSRWMPTPCSAR